eukprot:TRINITY_DN1294_c0_g1_i1.p1 TRINITY_DN1294_c0_g1~~TRINITY_DN1294_c0_g1_i1.p1  ORF type:complete len:400 (+),score=97.17 TRINITY_DN1294_c0_g1_i1:85-1284(+)
MSDHNSAGTVQDVGVSTAVEISPPSGKHETHHPQQQEHHEGVGTIKEQLLAIVKVSYVNVLLIFVPFGIISHSVKWSASATFILNFLAIVPLAKLLGFATEELACRTSQTVGGLLNATFGNAVELIVAVIALKENLVTVVQSSLLGSILSNLLLVLGMCFFFGGLKHKEQEFNVTAAQASSSMLAIACISLIIPAAFVATAGSAKVLAVSHGAALVLLVIYMAYLIFQLKTHTYLYADDDEEQEEPSLSVVMAGFLLVSVTVFVSVCAEFLVDALEEVSQTWGLSTTFIGLVLLPIVGNAAEHVTAVTVAMKNKMNLAIGVAIGSSLQIALLVTPLLVVIGWIINVEMTLYFNIFETTIMFVSVLVTNYLIQDGKSTWLEGVMLLGTWVVVAVAIYNVP